MKRPFLLLIAVLALAAGAFAIFYFAGSRLCVWHGAAQTNELAWLQTEFHLDDAEMRRISALHDAYKPLCEEMCVRLAKKTRELEQALKGATNVSSEIEGKLNEVAALRAECQANMLRHFQEVSRAMPVEQGRRYLAEMQRMTFGLSGPSQRLMEKSAGHEQR
jgi:hypothetical protein